MSPFHRPLNTTFTLVASLFALLLAGSALANQSRDGIWMDVAEASIQQRSTLPARAMMPLQYRSLRINQRALEQALSLVPHESQVEVHRSPAVLEMPLPDGRFEQFRIVESPIMAPELAARYPQLRSWLGQGIDDPSATLRMDSSHKGLHVQIISWRGTLLIDPYSPGDREHAMVYHKRDAQRSTGSQHCLLTGDELPPDLPDFSRRGVAARLASGETLRRYRLAMAATGEYTQFHGGTVADGLAAIHTTMVRVNGIYERDLAVRMELIENNDLIVFTDGATDPYTNNNGFTMLGQNQTNLDQVIGSGNYDIGHVFSTGGGGVASLGSVCSINNKARGVTGLGSPIGDVFDIDFVAHEIGHQFRGNHAFNGSGGSCSGGNRNGATAYEPGSGITIQSYAGICSADNLQSNSESYFHRISLNEMLSFVTTGNGSTCATTSATGNTPPTISTTAHFTIPQLTPFELSAVGSDSDGDTLTYIWEQFDLGPANAAGSLVDDGNRPLFRSFIPQLEPTRIFPSLRYILNNANAVPATAPLPGTTTPNRFTGEVLPSTNRVLNFRVTARDNRASGGGTNEALTALTVTTQAGPFRVTEPNTDVSWTPGASKEITWDVANTDAAPIDVSQVQISLSLDGGLTWQESFITDNDGTHIFTVPSVPATTRARLKIAAVGNVFFDISDADFTITGPNSPPTVVVNGQISTRQGSPVASGPVAIISDLQDSVEQLQVAVEGAPPDLNASVTNNAGVVTLSATAECTLVAPTNGVKVYPLTLRVTDSDGGVSIAEVLVSVARNQTPTLGTYSNVSVFAPGNTIVSPSASPADANDNLAGTSVSPVTLPGGGIVSIDGDGLVTIQVGAETPADDYLISATTFDTCGAQKTRQFTVTVTSDFVFADRFEQ